MQDAIHAVPEKIKLTDGLLAGGRTRDRTLDLSRVKDGALQRFQVVVRRTDRFPRILPKKRGGVGSRSAFRAASRTTV
jgi:hypothetical protein